MKADQRFSSDSCFSAVPFAIVPKYTGSLRTVAGSRLFTASERDPNKEALPVIFFAQFYRQNSSPMSALFD
jgi:hypothetical protein